MQVFKSYFKILNRHMGQMIMYLSIFIGCLLYTSDAADE